MQDKYLLPLNFCVKLIDSFFLILVFLMTLLQLSGQSVPKFVLMMMSLKLISVSLTTHLLTLPKVTWESQRADSNSLIVNYRLQMVSRKSMERFRIQQIIDFWMFNNVLKRKTSWDICWLHPLHSLLVYRCLVCRIKFSTDLNYHHFQVLLVCPNWVFCSHFHLLRYQSNITCNNCDK